MAQHKYDLLTIPTVTEGPRRHHPWYKERLRLKFLNPSKQTAALNGQKWTFVADDIDDFRSGAPTKTNGRQMMKRGRVNTMPLISNKSQHRQRSNSRVTPQPEPRILSTNPGLRTLYSKIGPRKQVQQERVEREKSALLKHPLQLYPHLEDSIPVEFLDDVLGLIDPELKVGSSISELSSSGIESQASTTIDEGVESGSRISDLAEVHNIPEQDHSVPDSQPQQSKLYKFPLKKTKEEKEREKMIVASQQVISATQQSRVDQVTHDLVQWMKDMGDHEEEKPIIDESIIKNLFSSDYESKPMIMAPIHVVDLVNVPPELRLESREHSRSGYSSSPSFRPATASHYRFGRTRGLTYPATANHYEEPRYIRTKYGAWYLPVDLWQIRNENEELRDPREVAAEMDSEEAMKSLAMNEMLSELHGARGFKEFVLTKKHGSIMPSFLENVNLNITNGQLQRQQLTRT